MIGDPFIMVCYCDFAGQVRGKGFPASELEQRRKTGIGLAPTQMMINCFGRITDSPWGPRDDLVLVPDELPHAAILVDFEDGTPPESFILGDIITLDGRPWQCCPRSYLRAANTELEKEGIRILAAFEHEFYYDGVPDRLGSSYSVDAIRLARHFPNVLIAALRQGGLEPESFLPEYGPRQYEVTVRPALGLQAADRAVQLRELTRGAARRLGSRATFSPMVTRGVVGNGVHIHFSLVDLEGRSVSYDASHKYGISSVAGAFLAGILRYADALCAITAPSVISYERLRPNSWSASQTNLGFRDREACIRICPVTEKPGANVASYNFEFRAADAAGSPYLQLGVLVNAGVEGVRERLAIPEPTTHDLAQMPENEKTRMGIRPLPQSLSEALDLLESNSQAKGLLPQELLEAYVMQKRGEIRQLEGQSDEEICRRYADAY
jgi:glutamine synthetase